MDLFGRGRSVVSARCAKLLKPTLRSWGTLDAEAKLPALVELWVSSGEGAVRTLLAQDDATPTWTPDSLGSFIGEAVYRALRTA